MSNTSLMCQNCKKFINNNEKITHITGFRDCDHIIHQSCKK